MALSASHLHACKALRLCLERVIVCFLLMLAPSWGAECVKGVRAGDQLWMVSSRGVNCGDFDSQMPRLEYSRCEQAPAWRSASREEFLGSSDPALVTVIYVHGNRIDAGDDQEVALGNYLGLARVAPGQPIRFVAWSWPSEQIDHRVLEDIRAKAARTGTDAHYLARFIDQTDLNQRLNLIGYSYGARVVTGSLHLLGGGSVDGKALLTRTQPEMTPSNVVLEAAAVDSHWLLPGHAHGLALTQTKRMLLLTNECDPVLKRYHFVYCGRNCAQALGFVGQTSPLLLGSNAAKLQTWNVSSLVGKTHDWQYYAGTPAIQAKIQQLVFGGSGVAELVSGRAPAATTE